MPVFTIDHNHTNAFEASNKKAQNGPSNDVIAAMSDVKIAINSQIAESIMNFPSYQRTKIRGDTTRARSS